MGKRAKPSKKTLRERAAMGGIVANIERMTELFARVPLERRVEVLESMRRESQMPDSMFALLRDEVLAMGDEEE